MDKPQTLSLSRIILGVTFLISVAAVFTVARQSLSMGVMYTLRTGRWILIAVLGLLIGGEILLWLFGGFAWRNRLIAWFAATPQRLRRVRPLASLLLAVSLVSFPFLVLGPYGRWVAAPFPRLLLFWVFTLLATASLGALYPAWTCGASLAASALLMAFVYHLATYVPDISASPFSLDWSEASRYYYASLFFSKQIYGFAVPPSVLHPSRYLMQSIPFLVPGLPLWVHRLWQVVLWISLPLLSVVLLARRLEISERRMRLLFLALSFLFLFQGPVYYHLLVPVALVLGGFDRRRLWRSTLFVLLASAWAGISRINWAPVPGILASSLYLLEIPLSGLKESGVNEPQAASWRARIDWLRENARTLTGYFAPLAGWILVGSLTALGAQALYMVWSGNNPQAFTSSFTSDLLWYRLLPNPTYPLGVLFGVLLVSAPLAALIVWRLWRRWTAFETLRILGLGALLLVLFAGGLVVSAKIGGGSNLHNMDAYLVLLLVVGAYFYFKRPAGLPAAPAQAASTPPWPILLALILVPVFFTVSEGGPVKPPPEKSVTHALKRLQHMTKQAAAEGDEVLFLSERQLLTFGYLPGVSLVPDYEKVFLMEMAMSGNQPYLQAFQEAIRQQRFRLIVTDSLYDKQKDREDSWSEENNAWANSVAEPVMCYYWVREKFPELGLQLLSPRENAKDCP